MAGQQLLRIGDEVALPLDFVTESNAVLGKKGSGKTSALIVLLEEMHRADVPVVSIDPKGDHYGIRSSADGKSEGLPVPVFGGLHGDIPLEPTAGALIADLIIDRRLSCVLDVSEFSRAEVIRFLTAFADRMYRHANREPVHLFLEECHEYLPQQVRAEDAKLVGAFQRIVKMGRFKGIGVTLASQRSAAVNKDVLEQVDNLFVMRTTGPRDRDAISKWIDTHADSKAIVASLPSLDAGECWLWQPNRGEPLHFRFRMRDTYDAGRTPKVGETRLPPATLVDVDLAALGVAMADTIEKAKADDPKELRAEVKRLREQLAQVQPERVDVEIVSDETLGRLEKAIQELSAVLDPIRDALQRSVAASAGPAKPIPSEAPRRPAPQRPTPSPSADVAIAKAPRAILAALATHGTLRAQQIALLSGYSIKSSSFANALGFLRSNNLASGGKDAVSITHSGLTALGDYTPLPTGPALVAHWTTNLGRAERTILLALADAWPAPLSNEQLSDVTGYSMSSSSFANALGRLRSLELARGDRSANYAADEIGTARHEGNGS